jgi:colanic acid/amylovoran biosynthesis glycosyltransferase
LIHYITQNGIGNAWVANELSRVDAAGVPHVLHSLRAPEKLLHGSPWAVRLNQNTHVVYPLPPLGLLLSLLLAPLLFGTRWFAALFNALFGKREHLRARVACIGHFVVACHWARLWRHGAMPVSHIHAQWINSNGSLAMYGAWLLGVPFSFTGHATDLTRNRSALEDKIRRAEFIVCISEWHRRFYLEHGARPEQLFIVYCGIDPSWFYPRAVDAPRPQRPWRIVSSGRLVEKKGFAVLIDACKQLADRGEAFDCIIGGSGELEATLRAQIDRLGLSDRVHVSGQSLQQEKIVDFMHDGDVYVLPCVPAADGDIDGLPQMLMEAMASGLPAISTRLVGIPDLIEHERTGLLVEPNDAAGLADAIARLKRDPMLTQRLAAEGRQFVLERFDLRTCLEPLIDRYRRRLGLAAKPAGDLLQPRGT